MASGYKSDAQGFLVGEMIENGRDLMRLQGQSYAVLKDIRADVRAIGRAVGAQVASAVRASRPGATPRAPATTGLRTAGGNFTGGRRAQVATPTGRAAPAQRGGTNSRASVAVPQPRAANGRFVSGGSRPGGSSGAGGASGERSTSNVMGRLSDSVGKLAGTLAAADNIDPTINALKEVKDVVSPLGRGLTFMFGRSAERKKEVWYRRFLKALSPSRDQRQRVVAAGGMGGGLLGSLLGTAGGSAAGGLLGGLLGRGKALFMGGGRLLRRVPLLGALLAGGGALASIFGGGSRDEKYKGVGEAGGMLAGGVAGAKLGAALGTMIAPGIGTALGGFLGGVGGALLGEAFGSKVGEWTKTLVDADIPGKVVEAWKVTTAAIGAAWDSLTTDAKEAWAGITTKAGEWLDAAKSGLDVVGSTLASAGSAVNDWIREKTGVDVRGAVSSAASTVGEATGAVWDKAKDIAGAGWSAAKGYGSDALDAAGRGAAALVPNTVKRAYSAGAAAATQAKAGYDVARGNGTSAVAPSGALQEGARAAGGAAGVGINKVLATGPGYNITQDAAGVVTRQDGARNWRNNNPGNLEYSAYTRGLGAIGSDGRFAIFPDYQTGRAAKASLLFDGKNYKDKTLSEAIARYAPPSENNTKSYQAAAITAAGGKDRVMSEYSQAERVAILDAVQKVEGYRVGKTTTLPSGAYNVPPIRPASVPSAVPATIPRAPEVKDPAIPLNSLSGGAGRETVQVNIPETIGQNVSDRGIAHILTGGVGMG